VSVGIGQLIGMRIRKVPPSIIVNAQINATKAGLRLTIDDLEAHYLAGGNVRLVVNALISADKANIPVAKVSLEYFDEPVLLVERFDRQWNIDTINRLHLIDGCQILDLPPAYKYERPFGSSGHAGDIRTGASLAKLFNATDVCRVPAKARMDLLNWLLFQLIIGNCDAHGKNISFFVRKEGIDIAPAYDMLNIDIYRELFVQELAMSIGDEFLLDKILSFQLAEFCEDCGLKQRLVANNFRKLCDLVLSNINNLDVTILRKRDEKDFVQELIRNIGARAQHFKEISFDLLHIKL